MDFSDIVLKNCKFDTFCRPQPLHNGSIFVSNIFFNNSLNRFDFIEPVVKSNNLSNELSSLWDQALMNIPVDSIKTIPEGVING